MFLFFSGLGYRPHPNPDTHIDSTLIHFRKGDYNGDWQSWAASLDKFLTSKSRSAVHIKDTCK